MFYDRAKIYVKGGDGGNGCVAFRREKYVPEGGPWGGDGGRGGNVILRGDEGLRTLVDFRYQRHYKAGRGQHGRGKGMHGRWAEDLVIRVPLGTVIREENSQQILGDITTNGQEVVVARGGRGGRGNARFAGPQNKAPAMAEKGEPGEERQLILELKLLADVGLLGYPNAGKSTLIARVSAARPKIADYPFTTLTPNLGVVSLGEGESFVMADIPGLIEGAHGGAGLGHYFLRHVERTKLLVHVLDGAGTEGRDPLDDFRVINRELALYNEALAKRPQLVAVNKMDLPGSEENLAHIKSELSGGYEIFPISAVNGAGTMELMHRVYDLLKELPVPELWPVESLETVHRAEPQFNIHREDDELVVTGREIEKHVAMTDLDNEAAVDRLQRIMQVMGLEKALRDYGAKNGDTVRIKDLTFEFVE
ncbi:GTPase ObgE [Desulfoscipio gibsoniae]|uniref:GTPase Obg n=1 Tax=Desulfoscipio gibsoniae DSM 7213 TaxID=767817 RepID=R4KJ41_9FIRM|nr:GTPase ObgE [Desulfoscipio gibsoniae]AGL02634.1 Obg family GTPase CgtA [Desulfoscipio gibsoniae DSM 7213]